jgi:hypothetical protein
VTKRRWFIRLLGGAAATMADRGARAAGPQGPVFSTGLATGRTLSIAAFLEGLRAAGIREPEQVEQAPISGR